MYNQLYQQQALKMVKYLLVFTSRHQNTVRVNSQSVDDSVVTREVLDEVSVWEHPLFDVISRTRGKRVSEKQNESNVLVEQHLIFSVQTVLFLRTGTFN